MSPRPLPRAGSALRVVPATAANWKALAALFGPRGACAGCWCMWWRLRPGDWRAGKSGANRQAFRRLVGQEPVAPGVVALQDGDAVGWCAVAPRPDYPRLARSRVLAPIDAEPVWSVTCFFVARAWRGRGLTVRLLNAAADHARRNGARWLEGYPVDTRGGRTADAFAFTGTLGAFRAAGFVEVARRSPTRPIVRRALRSAGGNAGRVTGPRNPPSVSGVS